jgi:hydrogenase/urease accessory protein HupE
MNSFSFYLPIGFEHILDVNGIDHILFITAICLPYTWKNWRTLLWLVTAFTIGHSITLALSTLQWVTVSSKWIEFIIPITIAYSALFNLLPQKDSTKLQPMQYFITLVFGLVHGLGFSTLLKSMLGTESSIVLPLLGFNVGLELGQLIIVSLATTITALVVNFLRTKQKNYIGFVCGGICFLAIQMAIQRWPL